MNEKLYAIWLSEALGYGTVHAKGLLEEYGSFEEIYGLSEDGYARVGIKHGSAVMERLLDKRLDAYKKTLSFCEYNCFDVIAYTSNMYPQRLRAIKNPPPVLFVRGRMIDFDDNVCIGVVGTRSYTDAGWNATYKIASGLARDGAVVVTGLASGIDTAATRAALEVSGFAVGVLGSGVDKVFPSENRELFEVMYKKGLVISEKPPFSEITGRYFPVRNRLISGLCNGVLVAEGNVKSGAMITAAHASEQGRTIYAVPGDISSEESSGVNKLVREGAFPVFDSSDIINRYIYSYAHRIKIVRNEADKVEVPKERSTKRVRVVNGRSTDIKIGDSALMKESAELPVKSEENLKKAEYIKEFFAAYEKKTNGAGNKKKVKRGFKYGVDPVPPAAQVKNIRFEKVYEANMDKLEERIAMHKKEEAAIGALGELEKKVYECVCSKNKIAADEICMVINEDSMNVNIALTSLEMVGLVVMEGPNVKKA